MFLQKTRWIEEKQNIQWIDRPDRTGSDGAGIGNLGEKRRGDESIAEKMAPYLGA